MKLTIANRIQTFRLEHDWRFAGYLKEKIKRFRSVEAIFTEVYAWNAWGGERGEFFSGSGSVNPQVVSSYTATISQLAIREGFQGRTFVDLGCGDFRIGEQLLPLCARYIGVDIVKPLVARNQTDFGNETTQFVHLDITRDLLPRGDVCIIRFVLQHLSNRQISAVLPKLAGYKWVFITEHYPTKNDAIIPNIDKVHGGDTRLNRNSGVYLSEPPFALPNSALELVLEANKETPVALPDQGVVRTFLYKPNG